MQIIYHHRTQARRAEGVHIREIVRGLTDLGHVVRVVSPPGVDVFAAQKSNHSVSSKAQRGVLHSISRHAPQFLFEVFEIFYNIYSYVQITKLHREKLVQGIYERYHFFGFSAALISNKKKIPYIIEVNEISGIKRVRGQILTGLASRIEKFVFQRAQYIIVVSSFLKQQISSLGIASEKIIVLPNGVNPGDFNPQLQKDASLEERYELKNMIVLGFVGGLVQWHNFEFLFSTVKAIISRYKNIKLFIVGDGPLSGYLHDLASQMRIAEHCVFTGDIAHNEISKYIQLMDICIIPASNEYRSPIKLFEYMAMAKPVVAPRYVPITDVVDDKENCLLFTAEDAVSISEALDSLIMHADLRKRIGNNALVTVNQKYLWKNNALKIVELFQAIR